MSSEAEFQIEKLKALLLAYVELNKFHAAPGEKSAALWSSIQFIRTQIREIVR